MDSWWIWALSGAAAVVVIIVLMISFRRATLLRTPGSFAARLVRDKQRPVLKSIPAVVSYNEATVEVFTLGSLSPVPKHTLRRHLLELTRVETDHRDRVVMTISEPESGREGIQLVVHPENYAELSTWYESGPSIGIGHWREAPRRRQRRRYF